MVCELAHTSGTFRQERPKFLLSNCVCNYLKRAPFGLALNDYVAGDGPALFAQACAMGLEGIVSKRRSSRYRSGRSPHWLKAKNPEAEVDNDPWSILVALSDA
jgi:bifunctional non-homologous end joining protein LigD